MEAKDKAENTNFSRHQNLFNTLHNMGYILLESEMQEVVSAVEKDKMEDNEFVQFAEYFRHNFDYYDDTESGSVYKWREFGKRKESPMLAKDILKHWKLTK